MKPRRLHSETISSMSGLLCCWASVTVNLAL
jgi:hypothetical protein